MTEKDRALLSGVDEMIEQAPSVGLCAFPFKILREEIENLISERDALAEAAAWISVEERLPEPKTDVEVAFDDGEVWCLWQDWKESDEEDPLLYWIDPYREESHRVTHWKPMPEAPAGVKQ